MSKRAAIEIRMTINKLVDLDEAADAVNEIHKLLMDKFGIDQYGVAELASSIKVSYSILSRGADQEGTVKP